MEYLCDILIPEMGAKIGEAVYESLLRTGLRIVRVDDTNDSRNEPAFIRLLKKKVAEHRPRMILPIFNGEFIARHRSEFPEDIIIPISPEETIRRLDSKCGASQICTLLGIRQPRLYSDSEAESVTSFPVVFKRDQGLSGAGVYFPKHSRALSNLIRASEGKPHLVMDYIDGYDICVDAIRWGDYFHAECYRVILPKQKGISFLRRTVKAPELVESLRSILEQANYQGICGADFRIDRKTGKAYFLECNPRFSGGIRSQISAGFDMPVIIWQLCTGQTPDRVRFRSGRYSADMKDLKAWAMSRLRHKRKK